ncbi:hypothetical protein E4T80_07640 [Muribacter muris]|uniref:Uncharacterized protein n=1 Tax=Muribacter muris TaxID=67855 RepID=A0A4Y9JW58_9PAST|nr:hypothetical protein E4T80_07640 [Muribacter muris]
MFDFGLKATGFLIGTHTVPLNITKISGISPLVSQADVGELFAFSMRATFLCPFYNQITNPYVSFVVFIRQIDGFILSTIGKMYETLENPKNCFNYIDFTWRGRLFIWFIAI